MALTRILAFLLGLGLAACTEEEPKFGPPTEAECPPPPTGTALTYENFGKKFMEDYCTRCHDSMLTGAARMGATSFHDFDTIFGIRAVRAHIDMTTASGPAGTNTQMPPGGKTPSKAEREMLGEWLACDAPGGP